jgi:hypothetical protein
LFPSADIFIVYIAALAPDDLTKPARDLPEAEQKLVYATQGVPVAYLFNQKVEGTAWKTKPSWCIVATQDRTVNPELQRFAAKRMKAASIFMRHGKTKGWLKLCSPGTQKHEVSF